MKLPALICLLVFTCVVSSRENCTYRDIVKYLMLSEDTDTFQMARPVIDPNTITNVTLGVAILAILDMKAIEQKCISFLWTTMAWKNEFIQWDPAQFCGIKSVAIPSDAIWKPDITIHDQIERDKTALNPYLKIFYDGNVQFGNDQVVVSTCRIDAYQFPFDEQSCNLSFKCAMYSDRAIQLRPWGNSTFVTSVTQKTLKTQFEWIFINITVRKGSVYDMFLEANQDWITYTILMKRRPGLYIVNYILPLLFFLFLDFASFLISDTGDKLGFKITVLLAVTVMQLLFNEILPTSTDRIPLIAVFCVGIFSLMLLGLVESLVILYLINKDEKPDQDDLYRRLTDVMSLSTIALDSTVDKVQPSDNFLTMAELLQNKKEETGPGYWTQKAAIINRVFIVLYFTAVFVFLCTIFYSWLN